MKESKQGIRASFLTDVQKIYGSGKIRSGFILFVKILIVTLSVIALANPVIPHTNKDVSKK